ncbi:PREDICTED: tenascin isoform X2 [Rhagoletis zephyria]|uniref:tenascin isoform X2 n=1 Tax=Rhagoletis zephyria TaxID=28612 RepID=UPI00081131D7|nr:PREDICTED: tenascin isoform X2 [Rhagoletis zephyria]
MVRCLKSIGAPQQPAQQPPSSHGTYVSQAYRCHCPTAIRLSVGAKCRDAVFFQFEKDVQVVGNSTLSPYFNLVEVCCKGYKRYDFDWNRCVPDCGNKCQANGFCLDGGICRCFDEFVLNHRNVCIPICPLGCPNGQCYLNGTCICQEGYELDPTRKFCMPRCEFSCAHNEICVEPNKCECAEGYTRALPPSTMGCQPICIPDCGFGHCVAPNHCECFHGYLKRLNGSTCESNCYMRCESGFCANRTTCVCQNGYRFDQNTTSCLPVCDEDCENGICLSPGVCRCFNGYVRRGPKCEGICENGCGFYGKCIAPNVCGCSIVEGPMRNYQRCANGNCNSKGRCRCKEGYVRFIDQCMEPDKVTTYASMRPSRLNETLLQEFNMLIGRHFMFQYKIFPYY